MNFRRSLQVCVGTAILCLSMQSQMVAQVRTESSEADRSTTRTSETVTNPESPPNDSVSPDAQTDEVRLVLRRSDRKLHVYRGEEEIASYPVAIGRSGWETPTGSFEVIQMLENPGWTHPFTGKVVPPGPENPLGERWIAFWTDGTNLIGFHGTPDRETVGRAASHGCVRLYNEDVRELYELVQVGTPVTVEP